MAVTTAHFFDGKNTSAAEGARVRINDFSFRDITSDLAVGRALRAKEAGAAVRFQSGMSLLGAKRRFALTGDGGNHGGFQRT